MYVLNSFDNIKENIGATCEKFDVEVDHKHVYNFRMK